MASTAAAATTGLMQLPSPPDPPSSFALSALSLDLPSFTEVPSPPLDCDIVLPPPAESLYSLPRRPNNKVNNGSSLSTEQLIENDATFDITNSPRSKNPMMKVARVKQRGLGSASSAAAVAAAAAAATESVV